jgi:hypothetical protein
MGRIRGLARRFKDRVTPVRLRHRPIVILALRRGGSTMLAEAVGDATGVWFANEPYAVYPKRSCYALRKAMLPPARHSQFFDLRGAELDAFEAYSRGLLAARFREIGRCHHTRFGMTDRVALKVLNAVWMAEWFRDRAEAEVLPLLRHPGGQARSVARTSWGFPIEAYLERPSALERFFDARQIDLLARTVAGGDRWQIAIADWIVLSAPLRLLPDMRERLVTYEGILEDRPAFVASVLVGRLGLGPPARMQATLERPSGSSRISTAETRERIARGETRTLAERWREGIDAERIDAGQALLDAFEVDLYRFTPG